MLGGEKKGHLLSYNNLNDLIDTKPDIIVAGQGVFGLMKPEKMLEEGLGKEGIKLVSHTNKKAIKAYNDLLSANASKKISACFHLTC